MDETRVRAGAESGPPLSFILIGGPAGAGKSRLAHAVALRTASTVAQVDDLQTAIETLVPPERLPEYYEPATTYLRTDSPDDINGAIETIAAFFAPAVLAAISNRVESGTPTVFEGDSISPDVAAQAGASGVRAVFLLASEEELRENFLHRTVTSNEAGRGCRRFAAGGSRPAAPSWGCR